jgi:hypothetical protein
VREKKRLEKQAEVNRLIQGYQRLTIDELKLLLANGIGITHAIRTVIREKKIAQDGSRERTPMHPPKKRQKRSRSRKRLAEPYSGQDYMKPISEEYGMPEYDLE